MVQWPIRMLKTAIVIQTSSRSESTYRHPLNMPYLSLGLAAVWAINSVLSTETLTQIP
ncbi:hypothetical protein T06_4738 [Trichinella sp. T6]|nr:hypothetical protein T06_4738 [Trichinella sp. T6]